MRSQYKILIKNLLSPSRSSLSFLVYRLHVHGEDGGVGEGLAAVEADMVVLRLPVDHLEMQGSIFYIENTIPPPLGNGEIIFFPSKRIKFEVFLFLFINFPFN